MIRLLRRPMTLWLIAAQLALFAYAWRHMDLLGDTFWYIATGRYVLSHHAFPTDELFSYAAVRGPWFVNMPLSEPLFAWVADRFGVVALMGMCTAALGLALGLLWLPHSKGGVYRIGTWALAVLAIYAQRADLSARSQALADVAFAVLLLCMFRIRDGERVPRWIPLLLGAVWVNVHPSFLLGVLVPFGFALALRIGPASLRPRLGPLTLFGGLVAIGGLCNPYGYRLILEFVRMMTAESSTTFDLFRSPDFRSPEVVAWLFVGVMTLGLCLRSDSSDAGVAEALLLLALVTATCVSRRYVELLCLCEIVIGGRLLRAVGWMRGDPPGAWWWVPLYAAPLGLIAYSFSIPKNPWQNVPVEAAQFIEDNHLPDNVMNVLHWGGYLDYAWGGRRRIFLDGRSTQYENGVLGDATKLFYVEEGWGEPLDTYFVNTVLWENGSALDHALSQDPDWSVAYRKGIAVVYVRKKLAQ
jgi:hypothetical protein